MVIGIATRSPTRSPTRAPASTGYDISIANQTVYFGGLTLAPSGIGNGGAKAVAMDGSEVDFVSVTNQGGATRTWSVSGGRLIANGTPAVDNGIVLTCSTTRGTISVTIASSGTDPWGNDLSTSYTVKDGTELEAVATVANLAGGAKSILCRSGNYTIASSCFLNKAFANRLTVTRAQTAKPVMSGRVTIDNSDNIKFSYVDFYTAASASIEYCVLLRNLPESLQFYDCAFYSDYFNPLGNYTVTSPLANWGIYTNTNNAHSMDIQRCTFRYLDNGVQGKASTSVNIQDCVFSNIYQDHIKLSGSNGSYPSVTVTDNIIYDQVANQQTDVGPPHSDGIQFQPDTSISGNWTNVTVERNVFVNTPTANGIMQGIFANFNNVTWTGVANCGVAFTTNSQIVYSSSGGTATLYGTVAASGTATIKLINVTGTFLPTDTLTGASNGSATLTSVTRTGTHLSAIIRDNLIFHKQLNSIYISSPGDGTIVENNTCVGNSAFKQTIEIGELGKASGASVIVRDNIAEDVITYFSITETDNVELGSNGSLIPYSSVFDGVYGSFTPSTVDEALTMFSRKSAGNADREPTKVDAGSVGTGYVDFSANTSDHPRRESGFNAASGSWVSGTARQITGISSTGALVTISTGTFDVLASDGSSVVASDQTSYVVTNNQYVRPDNAGTITVGSTSGTVTTFTEAWVDFDGTNDYLSSSGLTGAADAKTMLFFASIDFDTASPASNEVILSYDALNNYIRRNATTGALAMVWKNTSATNAITGTSTDTYGIERVNILLGMNADATSYMSVWSETAGSWSTEITDSSGLLTNLDFTPSAIGVMAQSTGSAKVDGKVARFAIWQGITVPDVTNSAVRANFCDASTGVLVNPAISVAAYGTPILDYYGNATAWNTNNGSGGNMTVNGTLTDFP